MPTSTQSIRYELHLAPFLDSHSTRAPGIHIVEPSADTPQSRRGNLYVLVELMGDSPIRSQALRQLHSTIEDIYYSTAGSVSAILEEAVSAAHEQLRELNLRSPGTDLRAGIICAALINNYLIMASAGPSLAMIATGKRVDQFPPGPRHYTGPLGGETEPQITFYRHQIASGDVLFLGESDWILLTTVKTLGGAITTATPENRFEVVDYLRKQINDAEILGLLLIVEDATLPKPRPTETRGLPTALGATPPVRTIPPDEDLVPSVWDANDAAPAAPGRAPNGNRQTQVVKRKPVNYVEVMEADENPAPRRRGEQRQIGAGIAGAVASVSAWTQQTGKQISAWMANILPERNAQAQEAPDWVGAIPALDEEDEESAPPRAFTPPQRTRGGRTRLFILLAILIPLLTFATVGAVYLQRGAANQADGMKLVDLAEAQLIKAQQALGVNDKSTARSALSEAQRYLNEAVALIGVNERIRSLTGRIGAEMQSLLQVRALYSLDFPLHQFPADADPHRVIVFDQDVYVLDTGRQVVEFFRTDPTRTVIQENHGTILREGDVVEGITVGRLTDIAWQPRIPGFADKASLLILDRNNNIFRYNNVDEATYLRLAGADQLRGLSQIESYSGRLYLADEQQNQIWRYSPAGIGYDQPPDPWFGAQVQTNLAGVVATAIDGDIWMLTEEGMVLRYRQGGQLPFSLDNSAGLTGRMVDLTLGAEAADKLYLADGSQDRILVFDKSGNYIEQFQAAENNALRGLRGLYLDNVTGTLFILTQSSLYAHSLPR
ncbi:MAG: hypothetical protein KF893_14685 [Caldilineaceae bacterium]|nr:hypothetical protein [Caldilineaceae bacterium]